MRIRELTFEHQVFFVTRWQHTLALSAEPRARSIEFVSEVVHLKDGRTLTVPLEWFPWLRDAATADRERFELYSDGYAIHWPALDGDISIPGLFGLPD